jgi:signal transduction histidine kinase
VPEHRDEIAGVLDGALHGRDAANFEFPLRAKDGRTVHLLLSASARRDPDGEIVGVVAVGQDITEHREAQKRSLRAQRLESIGTLAGGVAHDVNNALAPILLATGLLRERYPDAADLVDLMESSARRGGSMVQQLLTFARGVDGKRVPVPQILLAELERIVKSTFPKNIQLHFASDPAAPAIVGDSTQLHQVLLNLCVNARDAMPQGGKMAIEVVREDLTAADVKALGEGKPGPHVRIRILDTGVGIAPELLDRIFEPFFSTKSPEQGTGLGLSTTLGIVRSHGGFVRVQSQIGQGSTFTVYLPAGAEDAAGKEIPSRAAEPYRGRGQTVLLVDDEPIVRNVVKRLLTVLGFTAEAAADGNAALAILKDPQKQVALVITDLHMPGMDGLELTREIRRLAPKLPVVLASGFADQADQATLDELAFAAQLYKPFGMDVLTQTLRATIG